MKWIIENAIYISMLILFSCVFFELPEIFAWIGGALLFVWIGIECEKGLQEDKEEIAKIVREKLNN